MRSARNELANANNAIERAIGNLEFQGRGAVSQDVVSNLRNLVEHVGVFAIHGDNPITGKYYDAIAPALGILKKRKNTRFIWDFHNLLQKVVSHYTPTEEASERLLLKYFENLSLLKQFAKNELGISILSNLNDFPLDEDPGLFEYHKSIAMKVDDFMLAHSPSIGRDRFYVRSAKPFFVNSRVYYETTLIPAYDTSSKFDHVLVFSSFRIPTNYSVVISTKRSSISGLGSSLPITIVDEYRVSIRPCELNSLLKIIGRTSVLNVRGNLKSYQSLMLFMTRSGMTLNEIASLPLDDYSKIKTQIDNSGENCPIQNLLDGVRDFLNTNKPGSNVLKYLLSKPRNRVIKEQIDSSQNPKLGGLRLRYGCIPFDKQPYCTSLLRHEVAAEDLYQCIDAELYEDNHLARFVSNEAKSKGILYVDEAEAKHFSNIDGLIQKHNNNLYCTHAARYIKHDMGQLFIKGDEDDIVKVLRFFLKLSKKGLGGYKSMCDS